MKIVIKTLLLALVIIGFIGLPAISTEAKEAKIQNINIRVSDQDFTLINSTGVEINALFITPHNSKEWGEDILGADTLQSGKELDIEFPDKTKPKIWDLRIEDEAGNYIEWDNLNLLKISSVELFYKNRHPTAILN